MVTGRVALTPCSLELVEVSDRPQLDRCVDLCVTLNGGMSEPTGWQQTLHMTVLQDQTSSSRHAFQHPYSRWPGVCPMQVCQSATTWEHGRYDEMLQCGRPSMSRPGQWWPLARSWSLQRQELQCTSESPRNSLRACDGAVETQIACRTLAVPQPCRLGVSVVRLSLHALVDALNSNSGVVCWLRSGQMQSCCSSPEAAQRCVGLM